MEEGPDFAFVELLVEIKAWVVYKLRVCVRCLGARTAMHPGTGTGDLREIEERSGTYRLCV